MEARPSVDIARRMSMLAMVEDPAGDERAAAINLFMAGAMLLAFHAHQTPDADIDGLMDFVNVKCRETIKELMAEDGKPN